MKRILRIENNQSLHPKLQDKCKRAEKRRCKAKENEMIIVRRKDLIC